MRPARTKAWAGVATARVALDAPMTRVMAGSLRSRGGKRAEAHRFRVPGPAPGGRQVRGRLPLSGAWVPTGTGGR